MALDGLVGNFRTVRNAVTELGQRLPGRGAPPPSI